MPSQADIRRSITDTIIRHLENNDLPPWRRGWRNHPNAGLPSNVVSRKVYRGINPWLCQIASETHGFTAKWWATFRQWKELGGCVKKRPSHVKPGAWGTKIVFWSPVTRTKTEKNGDEIEERFFIAKCYSVFNIDQVEGEHLDHLRVKDDDDSDNVVDRYEDAEALIDSTGADIRFGGSRAFYNLRDDFIQMPARSQFESSEAFYETAFSRAFALDRTRESPQLGPLKTWRTAMRSAN